MRIALMIFGQFRSFLKNLHNNLEELNEIFLKDNDVDVYILTDKQEIGNYSPYNENCIIDEFKKFDCNIKFIKYWEDLTSVHEFDNQIQNEYNKNIKHLNGYSEFVKKEWYRRYILNHLRNETDIKYDLCLFFRPFDTIIKKLKTDYEIKHTINHALQNDTVYLSYDTFMYCNAYTMNKVLEFSNAPVYHDEDIWNDDTLSSFFIHNCKYFSICKPTYCSQIQLIAFLHRNDISFRNIRVDVNMKSVIYNTCNSDALFYIVHNKEC